jgi:hypothetical protein
MHRLADPSAPIDLLVNNAGFGLNASFVEGDLVEEERLLDVLVRATLRLTHAALPGMIDRGSGIVINVSSVAGWVPVGTYSAAKAWLTTFTEGLAAELGGTGVTVTAVCPGFTRTEFHERSGINATSIPDLMWLSVDQVVSTAWKDAKKGRLVSVAGPQYQVLGTLAQYAPRPIVRRASTLRRR